MLNYFATVTPKKKKANERKGNNRFSDLIIIIYVQCSSYNAREKTKTAFNH